MELGTTRAGRHRGPMVSRHSPLSEAFHRTFASMYILGIHCNYLPRRPTTPFAALSILVPSSAPPFALSPAKTVGVNITREGDISQTERHSAGGASHIPSEFLRPAVEVFENGEDIVVVALRSRVSTLRAMDIGWKVEWTPDAKRRG